LIPNRAGLIMLTETQVPVLMTWFSAAFPTGAYGYSQGLEWAVHTGAVRDETSLSAWLEDILNYGGPWADSVLMAKAWRRPRGPALAAIGALAQALAGSRERFAETMAQGQAFSAALIQWGALPEQASLPYPVAAGAAAAKAGLPLVPALTAYLHGVLAGLTGAAQRLMPLGQAGAVRIMASLGPRLPQIAGRAAAPGARPAQAAFGADLAAMNHETLEPRIFLS